jgi:hypothetical protein
MLFSKVDDSSMRARLDPTHVQQGLRRCQSGSFSVRAAACGCTRLCHACTGHRDSSRRPAAATARVRRWREPEARPLGELSDSQPAELSDFNAALIHFETSFWACTGGGPDATLEGKQKDLREEVQTSISERI